MYTYGSENVRLIIILFFCEINIYSIIKKIKDHSRCNRRVLDHAGSGPDSVPDYDEF